MPLRFQDKHVIVTGGARSIGFEIARQFAAEGAVVSIFDCDRDSLDNADRQLPGDSLLDRNIPRVMKPHQEIVFC